MKLLVSAAICLQILHFASAQTFGQDNSKGQGGDLGNPYPYAPGDADGKNVNINKITIALGDDDDDYHPKKPKHPHWDESSDCETPKKTDQWSTPQQGLGPRNEGLEKREPCPKDGCGHQHHSKWNKHHKTTAHKTSTTSVTFPPYTWSFTDKVATTTPTVTILSPVSSRLPISPPMQSPSAPPPGTCPATCDPASGKNFCDQSTSCIGIPGNKYMCACVAGMRASDASPTDSKVQIRIDSPSYPWVLVKPGQKCNQICDKRSGPDWCGEVPVKKC